MAKTKANRKVADKPVINLVKDMGVTRSNKSVANIPQAEEMLKFARGWLDEHKGEVCKTTFLDASKVLGVQFSNSHNLSWAFSPSNPRGPFKELTYKYRIYVGRHHGTDSDLEKQEISFRELARKDVPEEEKEVRSKLFGQV